MVNLIKLKQVFKQVEHNNNNESAIDEVSLKVAFKMIENVVKYNNINLFKANIENSKEKRNILEHANDIIYNRLEDKERQYGPMDENLAKCARIASEMCNKEITTEDFYKCMIALKVGRMAFNTKYDTLLDACGYIAGLHNFNEKQKCND